jgi:PAS domain S-box-containing protein
MVESSGGAATSDRTLQLLNQVAAALSSGGLEGLPEVSARVMAATGAQRAAVLALPDPRSQTLYVLAASDEPVPLRLAFDVARYQQIAAAMASRGVVLVAPADEPLPLGVEPPAADEPLAIVPIVGGGSVLGCLTLRLPRGAALAPADLEALSTTAQLVAVALRGDRTLEALRDQTRKFANAAHESGRRQIAIESYRDFFDSAADGILVVDAHGFVLHVNRAAEQLTGYARSGLRGRSLFEIVPRELHDGLGEIVFRAAEGEQLARFDFELMSTSGERMRVSASTSAVLAEHGAAVFAFRDVTEARSLEDELRRTRDFTLRLIDATVDGITASDMRGNVILFNQGAQRVFGWTAEEVLGRIPVYKLYPEGVARSVMAELRAPENGGKLAAARREVLSKSGERVPVQLAASIVYEDGREVATIGIFSDLRERMVIEQRLAEAQSRLLASEKQAMLAELAGATAHELNQPLTSVMGYSEMLLKRLADSDPNRRAAAIVLRETERMAEIVRKIGRITRYETRPYVGATAILDIEKSAGSS